MQGVAYYLGFSYHLSKILEHLMCFTSCCSQFLSFSLLCHNDPYILGYEIFPHRTHCSYCIMIPLSIHLCDHQRHRECFPMDAPLRLTWTTHASHSQLLP